MEQEVKIIKGLDVIGHDISDGMLEIGRKKIKTLKLENRIKMLKGLCFFKVIFFTQFQCLLACEDLCFKEIHRVGGVFQTKKKDSKIFIYLLP
ncbi:MAG TPA: hypothetical protein VF849_00305 [Blattabacteriaceae bacterium]